MIIQLVVAMVAAGEPQCKVTKRRAHGQGADEDDVWRLLPVYAGVTGRSFRYGGDRVRVGRTYVFRGEERGRG